MPKTYTPIATYTVPVSTATSYTFSSIPGTYTDLVLICNLKATTADSSIVVRLNGDGGTNYSTTQMYGNASAAFSQRFTSDTVGYLSYGGFPTATFTSTIANFMNYSNTTTYKTFICRGGFAAGYSDTAVNLWRSTAAVSSMTLYAGNYFDVGCTFTLYGIKAA